MNFWLTVKKKKKKKLNEIGKKMLNAKIERQVARFDALPHEVFSYIYIYIYI